MERRLAAVMVTDIVGDSRLMENDELGVLARQTKQFDTHLGPQIAAFGGRIVKTTGDGFLAEFPSVVDAVNCALAFQAELAGEAVDNANAKIQYRAGINIGDIIIKGDDIFGDGVNVAARLEAIAPPGGLCISDLAWQNLRGGQSDEFQDIGAQSFKNINRKIRVWKWPADADAPKSVPASEGKTDRRVRLCVSDLTCSVRDGVARDFADGLIGDLIVALSKLDTLRVERAASGEAGYVLEGNARSSGGRVRCNMQLREVATGTFLWAEKFDGTLEDAFACQDRITETVMGAIEVELPEGQQSRRWRQEAGDTRAYELFLQGRAAYKEYSRLGNARAKGLFRSALQATPGFLSASVGLARTHIEEANFDWTEDSSATLARSRKILDAVLAVDPDHSAAHAEMGHYHLISGDYQAGLLAVELAVALDPNDADPQAILSFILICLERYEDALFVARRAVSLNPSSPEFYSIPIVEAYLVTGRFAEAAGVADQILARRPDWLIAHVGRILSLDGAGRDDEAARALKELRKRNPRFSASRWRRALHNPGRAIIGEFEARLTDLGLPA